MTVVGCCVGGRGKGSGDLLFDGGVERWRGGEVERREVERREDRRVAWWC